MSVKDTVNVKVEMKIDPSEIGSVLVKLSEIRANIWTQPNENFTVTVQGDKVRV